MTAPAPHGYPDFQRQTPSVDTELFNTGPILYNVNTVLGTVFVGNYEALGILTSSSTNSYELELDFGTQPPPLPSVYRQLFEVGTNQPLQTVIPAAGPYCTVQITPNAPSATVSLTMWAAPRAGSIQNGFKDNVLITNDHTALAAGNIVPLNAARTWPGAAVWTAGQDAGAYEARLQVLDYQGNVTTIDRISDAAGKLVQHNVYLPNGIIRVLFHNASAATANVDCFLVAKPYNF